MGLVYRVNQIFLNKEFALKTIDKHFMSEIAVRRFQQEARTAFSLEHPSIIAVNDFGVLDDQSPFLVMDLVRGETLGERLKRTGPLTLEEAIPIFVQVCFGLAYAHECDVVHRDIKPNNIMLLKGMPLGSEGSVKIVDFGIAKFTQHEGGEMQALTRTGEIFGSPLYMSPEQCSGGRVDHRADSCDGAGKLTQAVQLYKRALALREKCSGGRKDDWFLAATISSLASCYLDQGNFKEAKALYTRSLAISATAAERYDLGVFIRSKGWQSVINTKARLQKPIKC
jgi:serine/threonine protein kinase